MPFSPVHEILEELRAGRMIVLVDDEKRENEGDLVCAAERITPEVVNFMVTHARGLLCVAMDGPDCDHLELTPQGSVNTAQLGTAFTISVDAHERFGITTGVSATDRATTIRLLSDPTTQPADLNRPGHVHPLRARAGGVLVRTGQTEGGVDLCRMAGLRPAAAIIEIMNADGSMARRPELEALCSTHHLKMCRVADVIAHRLRSEKLVERIGVAPFASEYGDFRLIAYRSRVDPLPHVALCLGRVGVEPVEEPVLVRVHAHNLLGDVFADRASPSGRILQQAMQQIQAAGEGAVLYLRQPGAGTGLLKELQTMHWSGGPPRSDIAADATTNVGIGSQILLDLGVRRLRLLTNHPLPYGLDGFGLSVDEFVPIEL